MHGFALGTAVTQTGAVTPSPCFRTGRTSAGVHPYSLPLAWSLTASTALRCTHAQHVPCSPVAHFTRPHKHSVMAAKRNGICIPVPNPNVPTVACMRARLKPSYNSHPPCAHCRTHYIHPLWTCAAVNTARGSWPWSTQAPPVPAIPKDGIHPVGFSASYM